MRAKSKLDGKLGQQSWLVNRLASPTSQLESIEPPSKIPSVELQEGDVHSCTIHRKDFVWLRWRLSRRRFLTAVRVGEVGIRGFFVWNASKSIPRRLASANRRFLACDRSRRRVTPSLPSCPRRFAQRIRIFRRCPHEKSVHDSKSNNNVT